MVDAKTISSSAAQQVFPFGTLGDITDSPVTGLWQSWACGRVRFIMPPLWKK